MTMDDQAWPAVLTDCRTAWTSKSDILHASEVLTSQEGLFRQTIDCKASEKIHREKPEGLGRWLKAAPDQLCAGSLILGPRGFLSLHLATQDWLGDGESVPHEPTFGKHKSKTSWGSLKRLQGISGPLKRALTASLRLCPRRVTLHSNPGICLIVHLRLVSKDFYKLESELTSLTASFHFC